MPPVLLHGDHVVPPIIQTKSIVDSNYNENIVVDGSRSEFTRLRLENQAFQLLLREHLNKSVSYQEKENGTEVLFTRQANPAKNNTTPAPTIPIVQNQRQSQSVGQITEKAKAVHILTPKVPVVPQRQLSENDPDPKVWA